MKFATKFTPIAIALAALAAGPVMAGGDTDIDIERNLDTDRYIDVKGDVYVKGFIPVFSSSTSVTKQKQDSHDNDVDNKMVDNNAKAQDNVLRGSSGNIGLNITAGDFNAQDNSTALSAIDASFVFATADSHAKQEVEDNKFDNYGVRNNAKLSDNVLRDASGNIQVNVSAGNANLQANSLSASVNNSGTMAEATSSSEQKIHHNYTDNTGMLKKVYDKVDVKLGGVMVGKYEGTSDQIGDVYLDTWDGALPHPSGSSTGHIDVDSAAQGAQDLNGDGGAFAFNEEGVIGLLGVFSGEVVTTRWIVRPHENNANLSGNVLRDASGNIAVNVAAGTNNLQGNHLAIAAGLAAPANGGGGGGE